MAKHSSLHAAITKELCHVAESDMCDVLRFGCNFLSSGAAGMLQAYADSFVIAYFLRCIGASASSAFISILVLKGDAPDSTSAPATWDPI